MSHRDIQNVAASPIVADEIDWMTDVFEFADEPRGVVVDRGIPAIGNRGTEPRRRQAQRLVVAECDEFIDQ
jgi:hypothetical protein